LAPAPGKAVLPASVLPLGDEILLTREEVSMIVRRDRCLVCGSPQIAEYKERYGPHWIVVTYCLDRGHRAIKPIADKSVGAWMTGGLMERCRRLGIEKEVQG